MPKYVSLKLPPGVFRNGTKYQAKGRWYKANLIRWSEGVMSAIGGWEKVLDSNDAALDLTDPVRGLLGWRSNGQAPYLAFGTKGAAYGFSDGVLTDITPGGFSTGGEDATSSAGGYGSGAYGAGAYGAGSDAGTGAVVEANSWQFDSFGEQLIGCAYSDGKIYYWDLNVSNDFVVVSASAPVGNKGVFVTPERFVVALGGGNYATPGTADGRQLAWCDQEDYTEWNPAASASQAGDFILPGAGQLMCGARNRTESLLWTDVDLFAMRYIGGRLVYSFAQVGANCGIISRRAHAEVDGRSYWMGHRGFFLYDGFAQPMTCEISDAIFGDMNTYQKSKIVAWPASAFNEIWFAYPSSSSNENNRIVVYNFLEDHWSGPWGIDETSPIVRTDGIDRSVTGSVVTVDSEGGVYYQETGTNMLAEDDATTLVPKAETGPFEIGAGDNLVTINRYIPDENTYGDVDMDIYAAMSPTDPTEDQQTDLTMAEITDVRITGRQIRLKIEQVVPGWQFGVPRLEVIQRGRR